MHSLFVALGAVIAFSITAFSGVFLIPFLQRLKFGQTIREEGPVWHQKKQGTPTMGGLMFILGIVIAVMVAVPLHMSFAGAETLLATIRVFSGLLMACAYGIVGFMDDFISIRKKRNLGLNEKQKLIFQFLIAGAYLFSVQLAGGTTETVIPFVGMVDFGFFYYIIAAVLIVGIVNAVNFADGIDGLCSTITFVAALALMICAFILNYAGVSVMAAAIAGGCIGFLVWNFTPAKVFMGDTGSLFLGGAVCALAFGINMPILLVPVGIVYIIEMASVVIQVTYFKATKGKRIFKMSPIHHHFEMSGWSEVKICTVFGLISAIGGAVAVLAVYFS